MSRTTRSTASVLLGLHILLGLYALSDVCSKAAAGTEFLSLPFLLFYGAILALLGIYALGWQQVIKRMPLTTAYANRAITIVWGMFWGCVVFGETITPGKILGAAIIISGILLYVLSDRKDNRAAGQTTEAEAGVNDAGEARGDAAKTEANGGDER